MHPFELLARGDAVIRAVAVALLAMSLASWMTILWKAWLLRGGTRAVLRSIGAFWQARSLADAQHTLQHFDRVALVWPAIAAVREQLASAPNGDTLEAVLAHRPRVARVLRDALHGALRRLQSGQILLATVGATAPFVGLLGTVWGIYGALLALARESGAFTIDRIAAPVGEALVMTAFGLAVAIPAVLAYNVFGRVIARIEVELEGFAHDLLEALAPAAAAPSVLPARADGPAEPAQGMSDGFRA